MDIKAELMKCKVTLGGAVLLLISLFLPWLAAESAGVKVTENAWNVGFGIISGMEEIAGGFTMGWFFLILVLIAAALLLFTQYGKWTGIGAGALSVIVAGLAMYQIASFEIPGAGGMFAGLVPEFSIGWGLYVALVGAIAMIVGGFMHKEAAV